MRVLLDGRDPKSRGFARVLQGLVSPGMVPPGVEVCMLCTSEYAGSLGKLDAGVELLEEPILSNPAKHAQAKWWSEEYPVLVKKVAPDVIFHPAGYSAEDARLGVPSVIRSTNLLPFEPREIARYGASRTTMRFLLWRRRMIRDLREAAGVIFLSEHMRRIVLRQVPKIGKNTVVSLGLNPSFRAPTPSRRPLETPVRILYVSTIFLYKHQWNVVEAVDSLRRELGLDLRLSLVGGGEPTAQRKLARRMQDLDADSFTTIEGDVPPEKMPEAYRNTDLFVFASSCESFSNTLLEAMGAGLPIACSDRTGLPDILGDGGVFFDPENPKSISSSIRKLLDDDGLRFECAKKAHERSSLYTQEEMAEQTYAFLYTVSQGRG